MAQQERKTWSTPEARRFGSFAELTQQNKGIGSGDGLTFMGIPIRNIS